MKLQPLADHIVAKAVEAEDKSPAGLLLPDSAKEKPQVGEVLAVGKEVKEVKVGDRIVYTDGYDNRPERIKDGNDELLLMKEKAVLAIIKE